MRTVSQYSMKHLSCTDGKQPYRYYGLGFMAGNDSSQSWYTLYSLDTPFMAQESQNEQDYFLRQTFIIIFLFVLYGRTQFPKTKDRQSKPNFNSHKPPSPHCFSSWTPSLLLLAALGYQTLLRIFSIFKSDYLMLAT